MNAAVTALRECRRRRRRAVVVIVLPGRLLSLKDTLRIWPLTLKSLTNPPTHLPVRPTFHSGSPLSTSAAESPVDEEEADRPTDRSIDYLEIRRRGIERTNV